MPAYNNVPLLKGVNVVYPRTDSESVITNTATGRRLNQSLNDMYLNAKDYGLVGDNITDDYTALGSMIMAIGTSKKDILFPSGIYLIGTSITIPKNINIIFANGAVLSPNTGVTITLNGKINAGLDQIFSGNGSYSIYPPKNRVGYPEWFGAMPDTQVFDSLSAIKKCVDLFPVTQLQQASYFIYDKLVINNPHRILQGVDEYYSDASNKASRLVIMSSSVDAIFIGFSNKPATINEFLKKVTIKNIDITRGITVTPPVIGSEITGCAGIRLQYTLETNFEHVHSVEHSIGYCLNGTVSTRLDKCFAFRSLAGNGTAGTNDIFYGFMLNGNMDIGAAGGNASSYLTECTATIAGSPALTSSCAYLLQGKPVDTFITKCECSGVATTIQVSGDSSQAGNADVHIINLIADGYTSNGILLQDIGNYGAIDISNCYFAPVGGSSDNFGMRVENCTGMISFTNNQVVTHQNDRGIGLWVNGSSGVTSQGNMYLGSTRPVVLINSSNNKVADIINNPEQTALEAAIVVTNSHRNIINTIVKGGTTKYPIGIKATTSNYNEFNVTGINSSALTSGSANKIVVDGTQIIATGLVGTNLVSGVMA